MASEFDYYGISSNSRSRNQREKSSHKREVIEQVIANCKKLQSPSKPILFSRKTSKTKFNFLNESKNNQDSYQLNKLSPLKRLQLKKHRLIQGKNNQSQSKQNSKQYSRIQQLQTGSIRKKNTDSGSRNSEMCKINNLQPISPRSIYTQNPDNKSTQLIQHKQYYQEQQRQLKAYYFEIQSYIQQLKNKQILKLKAASQQYELNQYGNKKSKLQVNPKAVFNFYGCVQTVQSPSKNKQNLFDGVNFSFKIKEF